jgi:hypothetical protein
MMISAITEAVEKVTGISFEEFTGPSKKRDRYFARLIFAQSLMRHARIHYKIVATMINRDSSSVFKYPEFYRNEQKYNPDFRKLARLTEERLVKAYQCNTQVIKTLQ